MSNLKKIKNKLTSLYINFFKKKSTVIAINIENNFIDLKICLPQKVKWCPSEKIQFQISENEVRSYTPYLFENDSKTFRTLIYDNQKGRGAYFCRHLLPMNQFKILGPFKTKPIPFSTKNNLFFGDESSLGLGFSLREHFDYFLFECHDKSEFENYLNKYFQFKHIILFQRTCNSSEVTEQITNKILELNPDLCYLSGQKESIQDLKRNILLKNYLQMKIILKPYWSKSFKRS